MESRNINNRRSCQHLQQPIARSTIEIICLVACLICLYSNISVCHASSDLIQKTATLMTECGTSSSSNRISDGNTVVQSEFPWMALLEHKEKTTGKSRFPCIGSLISDQYVLTAGHCASTVTMPSDLQLVSVRLGEHDIRKEKNCESSGNECAPPPAQNHLIDHVIVHKDHKPELFSNDIALIKLKTKVSFDNSVRPICLPVSQGLNNNPESAIAARWGHESENGPSADLHKTELVLLPNKYCGMFYKGINLTSVNICAGGREWKIGGGQPLFNLDGSSPPKFVLYGVTVGNYRYSDDSDAFLSVYTNVTSYLPWIIENMGL